MRIAQIAPIIERVPPKKYGGIERVVYHLTEALVSLGHDVTLFASGDSITSAKLVSVVPKSLKEMSFNDPYGANVLTALHIGAAYKMQDQFDIIHDHCGILSLPTANIAQTPVVCTYHGPFNNEIKKIFSVLNTPGVITLSKSQAQGLPSTTNHIGTVYNGLPLQNYPFSDQHEGYLLFVGRITEEKGVHHAIAVAEKTGLPLLIAAKLETNYQPDVDYFEKYIEPKLSNMITWIGEVDETQRNQLMSKALCFLHPVTWPEPFGLTLIESMACGTPVIGFDKGAIPELIVHEKTGFVVADEAAMIKAIQSIHLINRSDCRQYALQHFSDIKMAQDYTKLYQSFIAKQQHKANKVSASSLQGKTAGMLQFYNNRTSQK